MGGIEHNRTRIRRGTLSYPGDRRSNSTLASGEREVFRHAVTPEGLHAQAQIVKAIFDGGGLRTPQSVLEGTFQSFMHEYAVRARSDMQAVIGLPLEQTTPAVEGQVVSLDNEHQDMVINYLLDVYGVSQQISDENMDKLRLSPNIGAYGSALNLRDQVRALEGNTSVHIMGPVVQIRFRTDKSFTIFNNILSGGTAKGFFVPLPVRNPGAEPELTHLHNVFVNFVSDEGEFMEGQSTEGHELWHVVDSMRRKEYRRIKTGIENELSEALPTRAFEHPEQPTVFVEPSSFRSRLERYFFDPETLVERLRDFRRDIPELFDFFTNLNPESTVPIDTDDPRQVNEVATEFTISFFRVNSELPAFCAGFINGTAGDQMTDDRMKDTSFRLVNGYMPFGRIDVKGMKDRAKEVDGRWVVDNGLIDNTFKLPLLSRRTINWEWESRREEMLDKYSQIDEDTYKRSFIDRVAYIRDLQLMLDFFLNKGGPCYEASQRVREQIEKSIGAYKRLTEHRGNAYQALIELSLLPISHWDVYARREMSK